MSSHVVSGSVPSFPTSPATTEPLASDSVTALTAADILTQAYVPYPVCKELRQRIEVLCRPRRRDRLAGPELPRARELLKQATVLLTAMDDTRKTYSERSAASFPRRSQPTLDALAAWMGAVATLALALQVARPKLIDPWRLIGHRNECLPGPMGAYRDAVTAARRCFIGLDRAPEDRLRENTLIAQAEAWEQQI